MGSIKKVLAEKTLPYRERHNSRIFVDLAENIHIHYREYRFVYNLDEFFEFLNVLKESELDIINYLSNNINYKEQYYPTTLMIAGGRPRQLKFIKNSPEPNKSYYMDTNLKVELQEEFVTDEVHIHYRDFRLAMDRERFKIFANCISEANLNLTDFESKNSYVRKTHNDRIIKDFNINNIDSDEAKVPFSGVKKIPLSLIKSNIHNNIINDWSPNPKFINKIKSSIQNNESIPPIILTKKINGNFIIIDGHHRYYAHFVLDKSHIDSIITDLEYQDTKHLREAIVSLSKFDIHTNFNYFLSDFMKSFLGFKLNKFYKDDYSLKIKKNSYAYRFLRSIKYFIFGKEKIFKNFFEKHNK